MVQGAQARSDIKHFTAILVVSFGLPQTTGGATLLWGLDYYGQYGISMIFLRSKIHYEPPSLIEAANHTHFVL